MILRIALIAMTAVLLSTSFAAAQGHDRPGGPRRKTRSSVIARNGMAATSQPLATEVAVRVLREGGNAIDAAIAANAALGVVEPMSCGIGGDLFAIVWDSKTKKLYGLNASGRAPAAASIAAFRAKNLQAIPTHGPLSWSVPGCVDGWSELHKRFGSKPWEQVLQPAIRLAEEGFPVSEIIAGDWDSASASLSAVPSSAACFLPDGHAPKAGDPFRNPGLARSLKAIATGGRDAFYKGPIARSIVAYSADNGGLLHPEDFARHRGDWVEPASVNYRGYDVWELPPNTQGIAALQMLNILEGYDLKALGAGTPELIHRMVEAKKLAYEDRGWFYTDPDFSKVPLAGLLSKDYAAQRRRLIDPSKARQQLSHGQPPEADTIYMTVVDGDFNAVSLIQSNFHGFGSYHVPGDLGFPLQNRGCLFALDEQHPNRLEPGKRPFHTIIPGFVTRDGQPWLSFGVMGGDMQAQGHVQVLVNMIDFGMDVQEAGDFARWRHFGSSEPTGERSRDGGTLAMESGFGPEVEAALAAKGHRLGQSRGAFGGYQAIRIDVDRKILIGGSDPRKDGCALGY